ncbi:sigma-54-dependent transcriptional regulator [Noviherbaspirillum suwonense]|uniref:Two-component system, NtrC family, response regulator PilR n=1 Tax=Noviherbaspirillum suwonense TaxID=1224511 RepID=A0ABY1PPA2_9BURK|nr:sigma-54 dependent transcriptional regulator [Noviherbaspirillum suwonense]SMP41018.1 two-component system, NtrC family, response regulator PilR [Noviherbaspirillum suwonense]
MPAPRILIVDDEADLRELLDITFIKMGLDSDCAANLGEARALLAKNAYAMVLTDMRLPDGLGIELVREVAAAYRNTPIAVITAFGSADNAVAALKAGAFDYLSKPVALDQLRLMVQSALKLTPAASAAAPAPTAGPALRLLGESDALRHVRAQIVRLARSMAPVAITGESGTGKELAARDIHAQSARADKPFIAVNCGAIPEALMEAEFFGYRKGAFTGAADDRDGFFQAASGGTLMLDEVADLPLPMQVKLLRAIQERRVRKVGSTVEEPVDVRLISATHQNLAACVEAGKFRQDLYYRLNVIELGLPPLRERKDDIGLLASAVLQRLSGASRMRLSPQALQTLCEHSFPGNVRELENILERALAFASGDTIDAQDLALRPAAMAGAPVSSPSPSHSPPTPRGEPFLTASEPAPAIADAQPAGAGTPGSLPQQLDKVERKLIEEALARTRYNRTQAADLLGLTLRQLRYRMQRLQIHDAD